MAAVRWCPRESSQRFSSPTTSRTSREFQPHRVDAPQAAGFTTHQPPGQRRERGDKVGTPWGNRGNQALLTKSYIHVSTTLDEKLPPWTESLVYTEHSDWDNVKVLRNYTKYV